MSKRSFMYRTWNSSYRCCIQVQETTTSIYIGFSWEKTPVFADKHWRETLSSIGGKGFRQISRKWAHWELSLDKTGWHFSWAFQPDTASKKTYMIQSQRVGPSSAQSSLHQLSSWQSSPRLFAFCHRHIHLFCQENLMSLYVYINVCAVILSNNMSYSNYVFPWM